MLIFFLARTILLKINYYIEYVCSKTFKTKYLICTIGEVHFNVLENRNCRLSDGRREKGHKMSVCLVREKLNFVKEKSVKSPGIFASLIASNPVSITFLFSDRF